MLRDEDPVSNHLQVISDGYGSGYDGDRRVCVLSVKSNSVAPQYAEMFSKTTKLH